MIFRESIPEDVLYMAEHSINQKCDRKQEETIDYTYTLEHEDKPLMVGGFRMITTTTAWCWVDLSPEIGKHLIPAYRLIREWIDLFAQEYNIKRLQAFVRTDVPENERLVKHLGFVCESVMPCFFGNDSAYLYVRVQ